MSDEDDGAVYQRQRGRAVGARGVERAAGGKERLVQVVRGCVGVALGPQQLSEALAVHAAVGRQRKDLDQRLRLAQPPRAIGDDAVADGDRETAQQADARLASVARGSPLPMSLTPVPEAVEHTSARRGRSRTSTDARRPTATGSSRSKALARGNAVANRSATHKAWRSARAPCRYRQLHNVGAHHGADHQHAHRPCAVPDLAASARSSRGRDDLSGPRLRHTRERPKDGQAAITVINSSSRGAGVRRAAVRGSISHSVPPSRSRPASAPTRIAPFGGVSARSCCHDGSRESASPRGHQNTGRAHRYRQTAHHISQTDRPTRHHPPPLSHGCGRPQRFRRGARSGRPAVVS
jgi:hypothetical protein